MSNGPEDAALTKKDYGNESPPAAMSQFWQDTYGSGLDDMLQNKNGWLTAASKNHSTVRNYRDKFVSAHGEQLADPKIPGGTDFGPDWYNEHGYQNIIM